MKFEQLYPTHTYTSDRVETRFSFENSKEIVTNFAVKSPELGKCHFCNAFTRWMDIRTEQFVCSEECQCEMSVIYKDTFQKYVKIEEQEQEIASRATDAWKDIVIVVHNQLPYVKACIESIRRHTKHCTVYIWNNNSDEDTRVYLDSLMDTIEPDEFEYEIHHHPTNIGFIEPNNSMVERGKGEYIILLNSDCVVFEDWDKMLLGHLQNDPELAEVGCLGGTVDENGVGVTGGCRHGDKIDFVCGFCLCISRDTYEEFGLFNKQLKFAYCEDSDLSFRLKDAGKKITTIYSPVVIHYGNKTVTSVSKNKSVSTLSETFSANHEYIKQRWSDYLQNDRILLSE